MSEKKKKAPKVSHLDEDVYDVERIVGRRLENGRTEYLVKWLGYPEEQNSWEPEDNIFDQSLIKNFEKQEKFDKSKKSNLINNARSSSSNREDIRHSLKISSKKRRRMIEDSSEEEEEKGDFIPSSSTDRSSTKAHKDKDRHHRKHKHRSDHHHHHHHDKHRHKSSKLLKGDSESSSIAKKKKKHHEHDDDDILTEARAERAQGDDQTKSKVNSRGKTFQEFFERVKGKPKLCTPITCNGTTFTITEYLV